MARCRCCRHPYDRKRMSQSCCESVECAIKAEPRTGSQLNACTFGARGKERRQRIGQFNPERESSLWLGKLPFREM